ncbi:uncharacterized protein B0P05DRAFT_458403, partial [Gilbertella persicaria]|uniref:uncharacterized protein n=1 Tax=Gilbertella persicaria TaxID=101096 RepID=UPI00221E7752
LFVGDQGSKIKGHRRYGGKWKQKLLGSTSIACITNKYNTSQTCVFSFQKSVHPVNRTEKATRTVKGTFYGLNKDCISVRNRKATMFRDRLSALAI